MDGWDFLDDYDYSSDLERLDPARAVWAAGFFDGEGCVGFGRVKSGSDFLVVSVPQRAPVREPLNVFKDLFGGTIYEYHVKTNVAEADMLRWQVTGFHAGGVLGSLLPYLVVKREQAELAIQWVRLGPGMGHKHSTELREQRDAIVTKVRELKRPWLRAV